MVNVKKSLEEHLATEYPFNVIADPDGGYVIIYPDLPGCMTQVESLEEIPAMAEDARLAWIETAFEDGMPIPPPSYPEEYSGKFNVRLPRSLHRQLAQAAEREGVSLNQYVVTLLARGDAQTQVERRLEAMREALAALGGAAPPLAASRSTGLPRARQARRRAS